MPVLYLIGFLLWGNILNWGNIPLNFHDWAEINAPRLAILQDAVTRGLLPLHANGTSALRGITDRILSIPDVILSPQVLLLRFLNVGQFVLVDTLFLYTIGFGGLLWLKHKLNLSMVMFTALFFLFNFNGHILSHYAVGHITWGGYFLLPWFIGLVLDLLDGDHSWGWVAKMAALLFATVLQGSFHQFTWCLIFLGILALVSWKSAWTILRAGFFAGMLSACRLFPPALLLGKFDTDFLGGYPQASNIISALVTERLPQNSLPFQNFSSNLGYWEFSLYIGVVGLIVVVGGMLLWLDQNIKKRTFLPLLAPILILAFFSIGDNYQILTSLPIPLLNGERVTSRMLILPVLFAVVLALGAIQEEISTRHPDVLKYIYIWGVSLYISYDLIKHALRWQVSAVYPFFTHVVQDLTTKKVANHADPQYLALAGWGMVISILAAAALVYFWKRSIQSDRSKLKAAEVSIDTNPG